MKRKWEEKKEEEDAAQGDEGLDGYIPEWVMRRSRASAVRWGTEKQILLWDVSWKVSEKIPVDGVFFKVTRAFGKDNICMVLRCWWEYMASVWGCRNSVVVGSLKPPATMIQLLIKSRKIIKKNVFFGYGCDVSRPDDISHWLLSVLTSDRIYLTFLYHVIRRNSSDGFPLFNIEKAFHYRLKFKPELLLLNSLETQIYSLMIMRSSWRVRFWLPLPCQGKNTQDKQETWKF